VGVYIIEAIGSDHIKIGYTKSETPDRRLKELQTSCAYDLKVILWLPEADLRFEQSLHERFKEYHVKREWFKRKGSLVDFIENESTRLELVEPKVLVGDKNTVKSTESYQQPIDCTKDYRYLFTQEWEDKCWKQHYICGLLLGRIESNMSDKEKADILVKDWVPPKIKYAHLAENTSYARLIG
jgi:hypothetical protein